MAELKVPSRRGFLLGLSALIAAPAIVRASSLMPFSDWDRLEIIRRARGVRVPVSAFDAYAARIRLAEDMAAHVMNGSASGISSFDLANIIEISDRYTNMLNIQIQLPCFREIYLPSRTKNK